MLDFLSTLFSICYHFKIISKEICLNISCWLRKLRQEMNVHLRARSLKESIGLLIFIYIDSRDLFSRTILINVSILITIFF